MLTVVGCSLSALVWCFSCAQTEVMDFDEEDHRHEMHFHSITSLYHICEPPLLLLTVAEAMSDRYMYCTMTPSLQLLFYFLKGSYCTVST